MELPEVPRPRIGFVGRLEPVKGLDILLEAFAQLRVPASLVIVGDGPERQRFVGSPAHVLSAAPYDAVFGLLKALDVLVCPR